MPEFEDLGLQAEPLLKLARAKDGILLICGATGSGKSSTMAAMLNWINRNLDRHIVTIEDPIEYTFVDGKSVFQQREIGLDVPNFELAIKAVLRQNFDITPTARCGTGRLLRRPSRWPRWVTWSSRPCTRPRWPNR